MTLSQKLCAALAVLAVAAGVVVWGISQYGNSRVAAQEIGTLREAVSEAVETRKEAVRVDVHQAKEIAAVRQRVRAVAEQGRSADARIRIEAGRPDCGPDADRLRVFNDAIDAGNGIASGPAELPR